MNIKYLLDTNILSELSKKEPHKNIVAAIGKHGTRCATSALVIHELNYGVQRIPKGPSKKNLQSFLEQLEIYNFVVLAYDEEVAKVHADHRADLTNQGLTPTFVDGQIAATAIANDLVLVTRNCKDFKHYKKLSLENWFL